MAAERRSGYLAIAWAMRSRSCGGTGVVAGSGIVAGAFERSTASSQPGTREPWPKRGTSRLVALTMRPPGSFAPAKLHTESPSGDFASPVDASQDRVEHGQRGDQIGDVPVLDHGRQRLQVDEARVAHVHAGRLRRAVGAHEAAELTAGTLDRVVGLARRHA